MSINSVPHVKCFCNNKNVLCAQSMVCHFVRHHVQLYDQLTKKVYTVLNLPAQEIYRSVRKV